MTVTLLEPKTDARGYVCTYYHDRIGEHILLWSKAGSVRGGHFHKGISLTKDPEILILISGTCILKWKEPNSSRLEIQKVTAPAKIIIPPYTWHQLVFETDSALIEMNGLSEHQADTFYET